MKRCSHGCEVTLDEHAHNSKPNCYGYYTFDCDCVCHQYNSKRQLIPVGQLGYDFELSDEEDEDE